MKLTKATLKRIIKEELDNVLDEVRVRPELPSELTQGQIDKIHDLIMSEDPENMNMAQSLIDAFGGDPNYVQNYIEFESVGDLEKLGNKASDLYDYHSVSTGPRTYVMRKSAPGLTDAEAFDQLNAIDDEAKKMIHKKLAKRRLDKNRTEPLRNIHGDLNQRYRDNRDAKDPDKK